VPPKKKAATTLALSRLKVLAAGDEDPYRVAVIEVLESSDRLAREAALQALTERPLSGLRDTLRALYLEVDGEGEKRDPAAHLRTLIAKLLAQIEDVRDADIGLRAADTYEMVTGADGTANLRSFGLRLIAATNPDMLPYVAVEHVNDYSEFSPEPANTALQLLAGSGNQLPVYQWLVSHEAPEPALIESAVELLTEAPPSLLARLLRRITREAITRRDEPLLTRLAETIIERELEDAYSAIESMFHAAISKELHGFLALLLAGTDREQLLAILERQIESDIRRRSAILDALRVRTTPQQEAILKRWETDRA
jgi:hypothetical protein